MTRVLAVGFGPYPGFPANPAQEIIETLRAERWSAAAVRVALLVAPTMWWRAVDAVEIMCRRERPDALLLFGQGHNDAALSIAETAINAACALPDAANLRWPGREIAPGRPARLNATLPGQTLARMIAAGGTPVETAADGGDFVWNRCFYVALEAAFAPCVGLALAPTPLETARLLGRDGPARLNRAQLVAGAQAAIKAAAVVAARRTAAA